MCKILITKFVELNVASSQKYYESKGYIIPKRRDGTVRRDTVMMIDVNDLPENSRADIEYQCQGCMKTKRTRYGRYVKNKHKLCQGCNMSRIAKDEDYISKRRGENSGNYNPSLTDAEREHGRHYPEYSLWREEVYKECDYTCQCCLDNRGGNLVAHHLNGWHWAKDERFTVWNGVTVCEVCHNEFHDRYGYRDNTRAQFENFLAEKILKRNNSPAAHLFARL